MLWVKLTHTIILLYYLLYCCLGYYLIVRLPENVKLCVFCCSESNYFVCQIYNSMAGTIILLYWSILRKSFLVCMDTIEVSEEK